MCLYNFVLNYFVAGLAILEQELADFFPEEPDSKDFRLRRPYMVSAATIQLCYYTVKAAIDNTQMTCSNKILFMGTKFKFYIIVIKYHYFPDFFPAI